jgi:hypothetical protein
MRDIVCLLDLDRRTMARWCKVGIYDLAAFCDCRYCSAPEDWVAGTSIQPPNGRVEAGPGVLCLCRQLSHRCEVWRDRCRGLTRYSPSRGTEDRFGLKPARLAADTAYGSAATFDWIVNDKKIAPHIPVFDKSRRDDGSLSREDFAFDAGRNLYVCSQGKLLHTTGRVHDGRTLLYRARTSDCGPCPLKTRCCPKTPERKVPPSIYEGARDVARALAGTEAFKQSRRVANGSRCCSPTSSAFSSLVAFGFVARAGAGATERSNMRLPITLDFATDAECSLLTKSQNLRGSKPAAA